MRSGNRPVRVRYVIAFEWIAALSSVCLFYASVEAFSGSDARALGMGEAYTAVARNIEALDWNPANLGLPSRNRVSLIVGLPGIGVGFDNTVLSLGMIDQYSGTYLTERDKQDILDKMRDGIGINTQFTYDVFGLSIKRFGIKYSIQSVVHVTFSKAPFDIVLNGISVGKTIELDDFDAKAALLGVTSFSYAHPLTPFIGAPLKKVGVSDLVAGITLKHLAGLAYAEVETPGSKIECNEYFWNTEGTALVKVAGYKLDLNKDSEGYSPGLSGSGLAVDLGVGATAGENLTVSLGVMNVLGSITWNKDTYKGVLTFSADSLNVVEVAQDTTDGDSLYTSTDTSYAIGSFSTNYPAYLDLGVAYKLSPGVTWLADEILLTADWRQGFGSGMGVSTTPRLAFGVEDGFLWGFLPLRFGLAFGGGEGTITTYGFGLDLGYVTWDLALKNFGGFSSTRGISVATRFKFGW